MVDDWGGSVVQVAPLLTPLHSQEPFVVGHSSVMQPGLLVHKPLPVLSQLPKSSISIQTVENFLFCLKSIIATLLNFIFSSWVIDTIFTVMGGLELLLIILACFRSEASLLPQSNHKNIRKVRNPWPILNRDDLFFLISIFF